MSLHIKVAGSWREIEGSPPVQEYNDALGGVVTEFTASGKRYRLHTYSGSSTFEVVKAVAPFRVLLEGGGGPGGMSGAYFQVGGNGGQGQTVEDYLTLTAGEHAVTVGGSGGATTFETLTANPGGTGGNGYPGPGAQGFSYPTLDSDITGTTVTYNGGDGGGGAPAHCDGCQPNNGGPGGAGSVRIAYEIEMPPAPAGFPWAEITAVTGSPKRYDWTDDGGNEWTTFEWTAAGTATTKVGVIDTMISGGVGGSTGGWGGQSGHPGGAAATKAVTSQDGDLTISPGGAGGYGGAGPGGTGGTTTISGVGVSLSIVGGGGGGESGGCCPGPGAGTHSTITGVDAVYGDTGAGKALIRVPKMSVSAASGWV